jgi:hypothetical protein
MYGRLQGVALRCSRSSSSRFSLRMQHSKKLRVPGGSRGLSVAALLQGCEEAFAPAGTEAIPVYLGLCAPTAPDSSRIHHKFIGNLSASVTVILRRVHAETKTRWVFVSQ